MKTNELKTLSERDLLIVLVTKLEALEDDIKGQEEDIKEIKTDLKKVETFTTTHADLPKWKEKIEKHAGFFERQKGVMMFFSVLGTILGGVSVVVQLIKLL